MMLLALALSAQAATLETDPYRAALTCGAAAGQVGEYKDLERIAIGTHFSLLAGRHSTSTSPLMNRYAEEAPAMRKRYGEVSARDAAALLPQCKQRFPSAFNSAPATLPTEPFQRKMTCTASVGLFYGVFSATGGSVEDTAWFAGLARRFRPMLSQRDLSANGLTTREQMIDAMGKALDATLDQGNILGVTRACEAAFPA